MSTQPAQADCRFPRHVRVSGPRLTFVYERCTDADCVVTGAGVGSSCGQLACPRGGSGGANLAVVKRSAVQPAAEVHCTCGSVWIQQRITRRPSLALAEHVAR